MKLWLSIQHEVSTLELPSLSCQIFPSFSLGCHLPFMGFMCVGFHMSRVKGLHIQSVCLAFWLQPLVFSYLWKSRAEGRRERSKEMWKQKAQPLLHIQVVGRRQVMSNWVLNLHFCLLVQVKIFSLGLCSLIFLRFFPLCLLSPVVLVFQSHFV